MILSQISAMAKNRVIGINNSLPWEIPEDMKFFRSKTKGHVMIMGRKTFESLGTPLPGRFHIIITRQKDYRYEHPQVRVVGTVNDAVVFAKTLLPQWPEEVFIIGGGEIYKESLPVTNKIYLTIIEKEFDGDAYYPELPNCFQLIEKKEVADSAIPFSFTTWERRY
jgi:dihydrofolate reductase